MGNGTVIGFNASTQDRVAAAVNLCRADQGVARRRDRATVAQFTRCGQLGIALPIEHTAILYA
ncbi:Uncharacterised protein [Yersinia similis]|nr:Uncharacterised protein [Yersinia similis]